MPLPEEMASEKERLYEASSLRDDLNDDEASVLLKWGESQIERLAQDFPDEFEQKSRFLRQLLKGINRFVGQREFNEMDGQAKYMSKVVMYLEALGWADIDSTTLFTALPENKADMAANLGAILAVLSPQSETASDEPSPEITGMESLGGGVADVGNITENDRQVLENPNPHSINQAQDDNFLGKHRNYDEEKGEQ